MSNFLTELREKICIKRDWRCNLLVYLPGTTKPWVLFLALHKFGIVLRGHNSRTSEVQVELSEIPGYSGLHTANFGHF